MFSAAHFLPILQQGHGVVSISFLLKKLYSNGEEWLVMPCDVRLEGKEIGESGADFYFSGVLKTEFHFAVSML